MASVNIREDEFHLVAEAAKELFDKGRREDAFKLDDLARKMNHALSAHTTRRYRHAITYNGQGSSMTVQETESPLESRGLRTKSAAAQAQEFAEAMLKNLRVNVAAERERRGENQ